jgi:D-sedoheptulose 7-phosphate isomerase
MVQTPVSRNLVELGLRERNDIFRRFFAAESRRLATASRAMADRFLRGGRLLAFGRGPYATDAQHVSVEFVHPVIVGKRALPALDLSISFKPWLEAIMYPDDIVMGFGPPRGDTDVWDALKTAERGQAMTFALPGTTGSYFFESPTRHPFLHQELVEILYHTLWETVHVFLEHREKGYDVGEAAFLYPFLGQEKQETSGIIDEVAASIEMKVADDAKLREQLLKDQGKGITEAATAIHQRLRRGGKLIVFGNGGSATDANDFAIDCILPPAGYRPVPAISLSLEPANLTAIANDIGTDAIFLRQLIAQGRPDDVAIGISTSGGSRNIIAALEEATKRGMLTIALLGYDGGEIARRELAEIPIVVSCDYIPRIQEVQASIYRLIREELETLARAS